MARFPILIVAAVAAILALAAGYLALRPPPPDVVLITVDTLRADHLGAYGSERARTPAIDALAREGLVFDQAVAPLPETRPSHLTLLTSLYPRDHAVLSNAAPYPPAPVTVAGRFAAAGYETAGFVGCALFDEAAGDLLGFERFDFPRDPKKPQRPADVVMPRVLEFLARRDSSRPLFLWLHLFDPHMPYEPPPPYDRGASPELVAEIPRFGWPRLRRIAGEHGGDLPRHVFERARELYAGEVEHVDHQLGRFFDALSAADRFDRTVVLLTADHGECFEGGVFFDHSQCLGEGALKVPMILRYPPAVAPGRAAEAVEHTDVAPALLRLAGLSVPEEMKGTGLLKRRGAEQPHVFFQHPVYRRADVAERQVVLDELRAVAGEPTRRIVGDREQVGVRRGPWKYVRRGAEEKLYHLTEDPDERVDRAATDPGVLEELRRAERRFRRDHPVKISDPSGLDPEFRERLIALGYLDADD